MSIFDRFYAGRHNYSIPFIFVVALVGLIIAGLIVAGIGYAVGETIEIWTVG